ncbi:FliM/FliN family flagellar motor switch protein [Acetobacter pasteurianus]|uniref:FliM/FliN family flagellar motor switch protein n=1 Tax=Acetobacter pasteurianus TaxID=438 RepID=UPI003D0A322C
MMYDAAAPYVPEAVSRAEAKEKNRGATHHVSLPLAEGLVLHDRKLQWDGPWVCYEGRAGHESFRLFLVPPLIASLAGVEKHETSYEIQAILSLLPLEACLFQLEQKLAVEIRFSRMGQAKPSAEAIYAVVEAQGRNWPVAVQAASSIISSLLDIWPLTPLPADEILFRTAFQIGKTKLPLNVLSSLHPRDVVLFEEGNPAQAGLLVEQYVRASVRWVEAKGWVLESGISYPDKREKHMADEAQYAHLEELQDGMGEVASEESLPITISFEIGRQTITLSELRMLGPGSILVGANPVKAPVRLYVGGRQIGTGQLVDVEGSAGVRIVRIFGRE